MVSAAPEHGPAVQVRPARPEELDAAGEVVRRAYTAADLAHGGYLDVLADARTRARDTEIAVAVDDDGTVLGSVTFVRQPSPWAELAGPGDAEIRMLGVDPAARRRGAGRALAGWCIARAAELGSRRVLLASLPTMTAAHALYTSLGFERRPALDIALADGIRLIAFELDLEVVR
jgi:ribosomal protein S18 acetylase RimI-like enzyme